MIPFSRVLLHEYFMGMLLLQVLVRLICSGAVELSLLYLLMLLSSAWLVRKGMKTLSPRINRIRLLWNIVVMNLAFSSVREVVPALGLASRDKLLAGIDHLLLGGDPGLWMEQFQSPLLTEIMSIGYMLFIVFLFFSFLYYGLSADLQTLRLFCMGLFTLYGLGISGYTIVPAEGPYVYFPAQYAKPMEGYLFTAINKAMVSAGSARFDVFPSLHVGVGLYLLLFFRQHSILLFRWYLLPSILLTISTIYLHYHYFFDLLCGAALCIFCIALANYVQAQNNAKTMIMPSATFEGEQT